MRGLIIKGIFERDGITPKESHQYRVSRIGKDVTLEIGFPMFFEYLDGYGTLITSNVIDYQEDDYGVWVTTRNTIYRLDDYVDKNQNTEEEMVF